jgi:phosphoglycolate phosphatase
MTGHRLVVFDVDGTLIDSQHAILAAMTAAFDAVEAVPPAREAVLAIVGLSLPVALARLAPELDRSTRGEIEARYRAHFLAERAAGGAEALAPLYPGARAALDRLALRTDVLLGIATGKGRQGLDRVLDVHGLQGRFATLQTADGHPSKPDPAMLMSALAETGCEPARAVMVGDTDFDVAMGRAAAFATVGVTWGYHPAARLRAAGAHRLVEHFDALDAALDAVLEGKAA